MAAGKFNMQKASGGVASITVADGTTNTDLVLPEVGTVATTDNIVGFKNYIINGNFDVWQRGTSQTGGGYGSADRWYFGWASGSLIVIKGQDVSPAPYSQFGNYALLNGTSLVGGHSMHKIESVRTCSGKTVTLSYCYKTVSGTNTSLSSCYLRQDFGIDGSSYVDTVAVADTTTSIGTNQYRRVLIFNIPSIVGKTIGTNDNLSVVNGYSGTFQQAVWGFQLEEGSIVTPFEQRPYGLELSLCQRYYEVMIVGGGAYNLAGQFLRERPRYVVTKRVVPTLVLGVPIETENIRNSTIIVDGIETTSFRVLAGVNVTGNANYIQHVYISAEL